MQMRFSKMDSMDSERLKAKGQRSQIQTFLGIIRKEKALKSLCKILDLGCGSGEEAARLAISTGAAVYGIDINKKFDERSKELATLENYDGSHLPFADNTFDAIYSFHVLEHVKNVHLILNEAQRVLKQNGIAYFGVPNRERFLGYIGMRHKSFYQQMRQNAIDWKYRLAGRFENRYGAHAGFREEELEQMLSRYFTDVRPVSDLYYNTKENYFSSIFRFAKKLRVEKKIIPSVYVLAIK